MTGYKYAGKIAEFIGIFGFLFCCGLPSIDGFSDKLIVPKWYYSLTSFFLLVMFMAYRRKSKDMSVSHTSLMSNFSIAACIISIIEIVFVVVEIATNGIPVSGIRGTFDSPAGISLFLCVLLPFAIRGIDYIFFGRKMSLVTSCFFKFLLILLAVCVILVSKSRTALICLLVLASVFCIYRIKMRKIFKILFPVIIMIASCGLCSFWKTDSTNGRKFILATTWSLIKEKPLTGHGYGGFHREYMKKQGDFLSLHPDSKYAILADDVRHPLNELVLVWCEYGIGGLILLCILFTFPVIAYLKLKDDILGIWLCALIPIFIFSLFSYPFHYPMSWFVIIGCIYRTIKIIRRKKELCRKQNATFTCAIIVSICLLFFISYSARYENEWSRVAEIAAEKHPKKVLRRYAVLYSHYKYNPYFLYNYAFVLYSASSFDEAALIAEECRQLWSGYNLELLTGDIYRKKRAYKEAVEHYHMAYNMCPSRFAPLVGIMYTYAECNKKEQALQIARTIKNKNIKVNSKTIQCIKGEAEMFLRELK